jgi:hypothetical protein
MTRDQSLDRILEIFAKAEGIQFYPGDQLNLVAVDFHSPVL